MRLPVQESSKVTLASKLFTPVVQRPHKTTLQQEYASVAHRLFLDRGFIDRSQGNPLGFFHVLPLGQIVLDKLTRIIDRRMREIGAQRLTLSSLCSEHLFNASERLTLMKDYLYGLKDRNENQLFLAPTHEESVTSLFNNKTMFGPKDLPILLYQVTSKFRDEATPRFGLLRSKEFIMKDLYSFHASEECARGTYEAVRGSYERLFGGDLALEATRARATSGAMGGQLSHEFHFLAENCGQDELLKCQHCGDAINVELSKNDQSAECCGEAMKKVKTLEIAHTFLLGTKYSRAFEAFFSTGTSKPAPFYTACYGIGVTRLMAACAEVCIARSKQSTELRWPLKIAPFPVCVVPPKEGSKESVVVGELAWHLAQSVGELNEFSTSPGGVLYDDRTWTTVGRRVNDAKCLGCPYVVVVNKTAATDQVPKFEFHDTINETRCDLDHCQLFNRIRGICAMLNCE